MENLITYLAKASAIIAVFYIAYYALLRKETFFNSNRWFLLAGLFTAVILPLLEYTRVIWIEAAPQRVISSAELYALMHSQPQNLPANGFEVNWYDLAAGVYFAGVFLFLGRLAVDLRSIVGIIKHGIATSAGKFRLIDSPAVSSPFSFFNYIVYNSALLEEGELRDIIAHEKIHSGQKHSLDMIAGQLFCAMFWFNPFAWLYKKSVSQNLEFIADAGATIALEDRIAYQKTLLKITMQPECIAITNHFYQSLIKKRIVMLNTQKSDKKRSWKYAVVLPALVAFMLLFQVKTVAQEKQPAKTASSAEKVKIALEVHKDSKDAELEADKKVFKDEFDTDVTFSNITRNSKSEITGIKVAVKDKTQSKVYEVAGTEPISPFTIEVEKNSTKGTNTIAFGEAAGRGRLLQRMASIKSDTLFMKRDLPRSYVNEDAEDDVPPVPPVPPVPGMRMPAVPPVTGHWSVNKFTIGNDDMLVVVDGVKQKPGSPVQLSLDREIDKVTMLKDKEGKKKYGKDGKKGVIEITTKKAESFGSNLPRGRAFIYRNGDDQVIADNFNFQFNTDEMGNDIMKIIGDGDVFKMLPEGFMEDQLRNAREQLGNANEQLGDIYEQLGNANESMGNARVELHRLKSGSPNLNSKEMDDVRKEMEKARNEMEKARKELEQARKEMQAKRKEMTRKV